MPLRQEVMFNGVIGYVPFTLTSMSTTVIQKGWVKTSVSTGDSQVSLERTGTGVQDDLHYVWVCKV